LLRPFFIISRYFKVMHKIKAEKFVPSAL
jgi:hypothetical protein